VPSHKSSSRPAAKSPSIRPHAINPPDLPTRGLSGRVRRFKDRGTPILDPASDPTPHEPSAGKVERPAVPVGEISIADEELLSARQVTELIPPRRLGRKMHLSTVHRWWTSGCGGVRLESIRIGGQRFTSLQALQRFFDRLTRLDHTSIASPPSADPIPTSRPSRPPVQRSRAERHLRVERELDELGL
jgi:hypothetical protein